MPAIAIALHWAATPCLCPERASTGTLFFRPKKNAAGKTPAALFAVTPEPDA
jgi:hypothetical protein